MRKVPREAAPAAGRVLNGRALLRCRKCGRENAARVLAIDPRFVATACRGRGCGALTLFPARDVPERDGEFSLSRPDSGVDARAWDRSWDTMTARMAQDKVDKEAKKKERLEALHRRKQEERRRLQCSRCRRKNQRTLKPASLRRIPTFSQQRLG